VLSSLPDITQDQPQKSLATWQKLAPLTVEQIIESSEVALNFGREDVEFSQITSATCIVTG